MSSRPGAVQRACRFAGSLTGPRLGVCGAHEHAKHAAQQSACRWLCETTQAGIQQFWCVNAPITPAITDRVTQLLTTSSWASASGVGMVTGAYTFGGAFPGLTGGAGAPCGGATAAASPFAERSLITADATGTKSADVDSLTREPSVATPLLHTMASYDYLMKLICIGDTGASKAGRLSVRLGLCVTDALTASRSGQVVSVAAVHGPPVHAHPRPHHRRRVRLPPVRAPLRCWRCASCAHSPRARASHRSVSVDGKNCKLQIWDTVRGACCPLGVCAGLSRPCPCPHNTGWAGVLSQHNSELLPRRGRRAARV